MTDLIQFSTENSLGPLRAYISLHHSGLLLSLYLESLKQFAKKIRDSQGPNVRTMGGNNPIGAPGFSKDGSFGVNKGLPLGPSSSVTLYQGAPSVMPTSNHLPMGPTTPQNAPPSGELSSPSKQNKAPPQQSASAPTSSTPTSTPASATNTTPSMAAATLKRKAQGDTSSPTTDNPPPKRVTRKRRTTGGGG